MKYKMMGRDMKIRVEEFLCLIGFHNIRTRTNAGSTERICMRSGCNHRTIMQGRIDNPSIVIEQAKKSPRMKRIVK